MKLEMQRQLRLEQRMMLAPRMIQAMEILQLPILALQERIEQELSENPVLELEEPAEANPPDANPPDAPQDAQQQDVNEKDLSLATDNNKLEDFERLESVDEDLRQHIDQVDEFPRRVYTDEPDPKLQALKNTAAPSQSLQDHLQQQWRLVDAPPAVRKAGEEIISYIDDRGYLSVPLGHLCNKDNSDFGMEDLEEALKLVQKLEPTGVGARDLKECLLIQIANSGEDMSFEAELVSKHMDDLLANRLPEIARKMNCTVEDIKRSVGRLSKLDTSPGLQVGRDENHPIVADVIVEWSEEQGDFTVRLADSRLPSLRVNSYYQRLAQDKKVNEKTRKFLRDNIRSARWIMDAIEQRKATLLRVARAVVKFQREFFERGPLYLKPLPMSKVADEVGVHLATVSRAVSGKYVQCSWGILPLRKFFSGGMEDDSGNARSWEAIRTRLQQIIDAEDKTRPLSDDQIRRKLAEAGIPNIARRTVAKYRKLLNIPTARFRKRY